jgi:indole-3-glycerol phosphate synthase
VKYVRTDTILDKILAQKERELPERDEYVTTSAQLDYLVSQMPPPLDFRAALCRDTVALIAEVKKASPSKGIFVEDFDPLAIAKTYAENGAAAVSVLTDEQFFQGRLRYLGEIREALNIPALRKDFIIDPYQVYEARVNRADAVLLIVMALDDSQLADLHRVITDLGMAALVEVHDEKELERALKVGATLIGVNNRDLRTFHVDLGVTERIAKQLPDGVVLVAESGIHSGDDVRLMGDLGARAVLVGEALMLAQDRAAAVRAFSGQPYSAK